jgi:hypothetical protein
MHHQARHTAWKIMIVTASSAKIVSCFALTLASLLLVATALYLPHPQANQNLCLDKPFALKTITSIRIV